MLLGGAFCDEQPWKTVEEVKKHQQISGLDTEYQKKWMNNSQEFQWRTFIFLDLHLRQPALDFLWDLRGGMA
jgi:hypothetical protein